MSQTTRCYCTLFDSGYLSRGIAMIESLLKHEPNCRIVVFCFDEKTQDVLNSLNWSQVKTVSLKEFETPELLKVKTDRSRGEYCWTSTSQTLVHCLEKLGFSECTYLDADLFFYSSPSPIFQENTQASVLITEHRYTPKYDQSATSGKYCVQFMHFQKNQWGMKTLLWWRDRCLEWCFARFEDGKFGDQKYLDDWTERFEKVHEVQHLGAGVAPWNVQQYEFSSSPAGVQLNSQDGKKVPVIFYHFHALKLFQNGRVDLSVYEIPKSAIDLIYRPYLERLLFWEKELQARYSYQAPRAPSLPFVQQVKRRLKGRLNYLKTGEL